MVVLVDVSVQASRPWLSNCASSWTQSPALVDPKTFPRSNYFVADGLWHDGASKVAERAVTDSDSGGMGGAATDSDLANENDALRQELAMLRSGIALTDDVATLPYAVMDPPESMVPFGCAEVGCQASLPCLGVGLAWPDRGSGGGMGAETDVVLV